MAKNRDRRREHKPEPPKKGDPPALRRARPDLVVRVNRQINELKDNWRGFVPMDLAKLMHEHVEDIEDVLLRMLRYGDVSKKDGLYFRKTWEQRNPAPPPPPKVHVNPALLLKVRKVFDRVATAKLDDFGRLDGVQGCIDELVKTGWLSKLTDGSFCIHHRQTVMYNPTWSRRGTVKQEYKGSGKCPWCEGKTRRHARLEVHDPVACKLRMIANIMGS